MSAIQTPEIFVTVGTQMPFDRLVKVVDDWAGRTGREDVFAQIGPSSLRPSHVTWEPYIDRPTFCRQASNASLIISHAGMGSILTAREMGKPILIMPRLAKLGEHRNDHQLGTVRKLGELDGIAVAMDEDQLAEKLESLESLIAGDASEPFASQKLITTLREFIDG